MHLEELKRQVLAIIDLGATTYLVDVADAQKRSLYFPDGVPGMHLPGADVDPENVVVRFALEELARREYANMVGKVVLVDWISGLDAIDNNNDVKCDPPVRVVVDRNCHAGDLTRWTDHDNLDPVWNVTMQDNVDDSPVLTGMRCFWIYPTTYSISGIIGKSDIVAIVGNYENASGASEKYAPEDPVQGPSFYSALSLNT